MRDEENGPPGVAELLHAPEAAPLELGVADGEHLVDEQDLGLEVRGDGEREPDVHAARVPLHRRVDEPLDAGELDDVVEALLDLPALHPEDRAVQIDVLAAGELLVEAGPDLEQAPDAARGSRRAPCVGVAIRVRILSSVDFPAPLRPMTPSTCPSGTSNETSLSAQISARRHVVLLPRQASRAWTIVSRSVPYAAWYSPSRYFFESDFDLDRAGTSDRVREPRLGRAEDGEAADEEHDARRATPTAPDPGRAQAPSSTAQRQPPITVVIGLSDRIHCHFSGIWSTANMTPERSGSTCRKTGIM